MPNEAEVCGLLALMLHCEALRAARRARDGRYVPLSEQGPKLWSHPLIEEAERHLILQRGRAFLHTPSSPRVDLKLFIQDQALLQSADAKGNRRSLMYNAVCLEVQNGNAG